MCSGTIAIRALSTEPIAALIHNGRRFLCSGFKDLPITTEQPMPEGTRAVRALRHKLLLDGKRALSITHHRLS